MRVWSKRPVFSDGQRGGAKLQPGSNSKQYGPPFTEPLPVMVGAFRYDMGVFS